ncbi:MAG: glutamate--tRNA ligase [Porticoccaceae bacterium]|nr:MAG: glutamate--tRNA ligase [Porticoccaceae bacterium]
MTVRTRVAPSPTGDPHVGTAYVALFNLCFARSHGGRFILRIEDTDRARSTREAEEAILASLRWLGLHWDEGPDVGGPCGPYRQSERRELYLRYAEELVERGLAFYCYRTPEELEELRRAKRERGGFAALKPSELLLPPEEAERRRRAGYPRVIRLVVPEGEGPCPVEDLLRGTIELDWGQVDAQVLIKSDGWPTYHLANVVDDHLMGITHVIRGEEWISSAPKHKLLYEYFGWEMPVLCHLPLLRNPDRSKLSKRRNPTSLRFYERMGFLPEALVNYLGRMGWSMPDGREKFSLEEMIEQFDIRRVSLGGPVFDVEKLKWLNGLWLREELTHEALAARLEAWAFNRDNLLRVLPFVHSRMELLSDFTPLTAFLTCGFPELRREQFAALPLSAEQLEEVLQFSLWRLEGLRPWERDALHGALAELAAAMDLKLRDFLAPLFLAITGSTSSFSVLDAMVLLGSDMSRARIRHALEVACGVPGKKRLARLEARYRALLGAVDKEEGDS